MLERLRHGERKQYQAKIASRRVSREGNPLRSAFRKPVVAGLNVMHGGRKRIFRGQAILRDEGVNPGPLRDVTNQGPVRLGRTPVEPTAM